MWANSVWGLFGLAVTCFCTRLGLPTAYEWLRPWFSWTGIAAFVATVVTLLWPSVRLRLQNASVYAASQEEAASEPPAGIAPTSERMNNASAPKTPVVPIEKAARLTANKWPHVFHVDLVQNDINLLILPDTKNQNRDAVCLIAFAAKTLLGIEELSENFLRQKLLKAIGTAPNASSGLQTLDSIYRAVVPIYVIPQIVQRCVEAGDLRRIKLSQGGRLTLTWYAETRACDLADDLEKRA